MATHGGTPVDLRSDTVTTPTPGMRRVIAQAAVGDDVYGEDPEVNSLQDEVATLFGYEAALFVPSGTMANQIALQLSVPRGEELLCDADAHILMYEDGALSALGGISARTWHSPDGSLDLDAITKLIRPGGYYAVPTRTIAVENTHNRGGGTVLPLAVLRKLREIADAHHLALHCDGARIWHAHVVEREPFTSYGSLFDTMSVCLSKGLGAPVGSLVLGSTDRIAEARAIRKRLGGGMRQAGVLAAAGRYAVRRHIDRLAEDHRRARGLADALAMYGLVDPARTHTNMVYIELSGTRMDARRFAGLAGEAGVLVIPVAPTTVRAVTHLGINDQALDHAIEVLAGVAHMSQSSIR